MPPQVSITRTTPIYRSPGDNGIFIQWDINQPATANIASVTIERSGSPEGPFELVIDKFTDFHFFDNLRGNPPPGPGETRENVNFLSLSRQIYYKITVLDSLGNSSFDIKPVLAGLPLKQALLKRKILRDESIGFKFNGVPLAVLKRKHWGIRCKRCFDVLTKKVTDSKCTECYGTGYEGGYYAPVKIFGRQGVENVQTSMTPEGYTDIDKKRLIILDYPLVEKDDVLVDIQQNNRYVLDTVHTTELKTVAVHQDIVMTKLAKDSVEYRIVANLANAPAIY